MSYSISNLSLLNYLSNDIWEDFLYARMNLCLAVGAFGIPEHVYGILMARSAISCSCNILAQVLRANLLLLSLRVM